MRTRGVERPRYTVDDDLTTPPPAGSKRSPQRSRRDRTQRGTARTRRPSEGLTDDERPIYSASACLPPFIRACRSHAVSQRPCGWW
jgi:hypothetical protein